jgi:hypothetical protein
VNPIDVPAERLRKERLARMTVRQRTDWKIGNPAERGASLFAEVDKGRGAGLVARKDAACQDKVM